MTRDSGGRAAGWAVAVTTGSLLIVGSATLLLFVAKHPGDLPVQTVASIFYNVPVVVAFAVVSTAILRRLPRHPIGWLFGLLGVSFGFAHVAEGYSAWELSGTDWIVWMWTVLIGPTIVGLAMAMLLFPTGRFTSRSVRPLAWLLWLYAGAAVVVSSVAPWPRTDEYFVLWVHDVRGSWPARNPIGWLSPHWLSDANALVAPCGAVLLLVSVLSLLPRWRRSTGDERQQIKWLGLAALLFALEITLTAILHFIVGAREPHPLEELLGNAVWTLVFAGIPVAIGLGIVRYRLYDIDVLISKTIVYGGLAVFIGLVYVVGVVLVSDLVDRWSGSSTLLALTATAGVAAAFQPLRTALQSGADRLVFGDRAAPYEIMTRFGRDLGQALASSEVLARIAETSALAVSASFARVTASLPNGETLTESWPGGAAVPATFNVVVPVHHDGKVIAEISVASAGARSAEIALLQHIAAVSSAALRNLRLVAELESLHTTIERQNQEIVESRSRLITAAEVERRRLEDVVAQRFGPDLDLLRDALKWLKGEVTGEPDTVAVECERLATHAARLIDEMRRLSRGVLPPLLIDHGLAAALRALLRRHDADVTLDVAPSIIKARFPAPIETTVYLCCQAALDSAVTGGRTASATLRLWRDNGCLAFSVIHNASLIWNDDRGALRDRITTLGGELVVQPDGQWSTVTATLPLDGSSSQA